MFYLTFTIDYVKLMVALENFVLATKTRIAIGDVKNLETVSKFL